MDPTKGNDCEEDLTHAGEQYGRACSRTNDNGNGIPVDTELSNCSTSQTTYTTVHYHRHLGPTAIAPGHKRIALKNRQGQDEEFQDLLNPVSSRSGQGGLPSLFDARTGLPAAPLLSHLLDKFFEYYGSNFYFINREHLNCLIEKGEASTFLVCAMSTLSSRFCSSNFFDNYFAQKPDAQWEYSIPFLQHAKALVMPALDLPSVDTASGLLMLSYADFGDNNEAGLWMYTGMALRMAQELGLHREPSCLNNVEDRQTNLEDVTSSPPPDIISVQAYEECVKLLLFWCIYQNDVCLCSGTGRVPSLKPYEINVRLPEDRDLAVLRGGPGKHLAKTGIQLEVLPHMARMIGLYAQSIDFLNTGSSQIRFQPRSDGEHRMERIEGLQRDIIANYRLIPKEVGFGANHYQAAVVSESAAPYLILHLFYHLQIAFLTQESLAGHSNTTNRVPNGSSTAQGLSDQEPKSEVGKVNKVCTSPSRTFTRRCSGHVQRLAKIVALLLKTF